MPTITINGSRCAYDAPKPGTSAPMILQVANANGIEIPQYCYHDGLSIVASCRICLVEVWSPDAKTGKLAPMMGGKLMPSCQTPASDGMVVYADSPKAVQNQKAVMEYLLINHPLDCPVCDQAGECFLQDYSYQYGRGVSRFEEQKVKQPKKDLGPTILLYSDRCIMCSRCVRFTKEVSGTSELLVQGRGNKSEIDVFPGKPLDNPLAGNVTDICPVGALEDKDFMFQQRVWFLKEAASIDPLTASGDNITIHYNDAASGTKIYRVKPRTNLDVNKWWITDEVRYGWKFVHSEDRLTTPSRRQFGMATESDWTRALQDAAAGLKKAVQLGKRVALVISPMLSSEDAFELARLGKAIDPSVSLFLGRVPRVGEDRVFPPNLKRDDPKAFVQYAEKAPNARGVKRVLDAVAGLNTGDFDAFLAEAAAGRFGAVVLTGNYPTAAVLGTDDRLLTITDRARRSALEGGDERGGRPFLVLIDTLSGPLSDNADIVLPGATFAEKSGSFENARGMVQHFDQAIPPIEQSKAEGQIACELAATLTGSTPTAFTANSSRQAIAAMPALAGWIAAVRQPVAPPTKKPDMAVVEL